MLPPPSCLRALLIVLLAAVNLQARDLQVLFLGDQGHHNPQGLSAALTPPLAAEGIHITYTENLSDLNLANLKNYDGLLVYANIDELPPEQEAALLTYVAEGGGFIPLHCASYCFRNSAPVVDLIGAQFSQHGGESFATEIVQPSHPIMEGFSGFSSWDETYVHTKHNERNRVVLEVRKQGVQAEGKDAEPWTWVRTHGGGRVFYTAWGHDTRTWSHPGFQNLLMRGIRWACGDDPRLVADYRDTQRFDAPQMQAGQTDVAPFEYDEVGPKIPNYLSGERWGTQGEILSKMQRPLPPEESIKHFVMPVDFHLELFVSEPDIQGKPIAMNWDEQGRLWICETVDYPNELVPPEQGRDRIRVCEDTDGDGRADKFTVFAEQLSIPTSLEFAQGGVIVQAGVQTLFLRDNDGDGKADQRQVLISGWELGDTHGGVSNFMYGLDNRYWAMQGYNNSKPKFAGGTHPGFRQGPFNFTVAGTEQPEVTNVEFVRSTTNNSWGLGISEEGLIFASTANRAPSFFVPVPNRYYERVRGWTPSLLADEISADHLFDPITDKVRQVDQHGGYTAGAGHALYTARNYPQSWWNRVAFVAGPTGHLVGTFVLNRRGASFEDANTFNLVASDDEWSAPIMAEVGPDGNVWIIDWYNYIVQHNPTPQGFQTGRGNAYESDLRDKTHGRIYRLVYDGSAGEPQAVAFPKLNQQHPEELVAALQHPNRLWRRHAQRLLVERGELDVVPALTELLQDESVDTTGNNPGAIHALWTLHGLGALANPSSTSAAAVRAALNHPAAGVRRNAALVLPANESSVTALAAAALLQDTDAQVQLGALMALADMPASSQAGPMLAELALDRKTQEDRYLHEATICAAAMHAEPFLASILAQPAQPFAAPILRVVAEHISRSGIDQSGVEHLLSALAAAEGGSRGPVVTGLAVGWPKDSTISLSEQGEETLAALLEDSATDQLGPLLRLGKAWGSRKTAGYAEQLAETLLTQVEDSQASNRQRIAAAIELIAMDSEDPQTVTQLIELVTPQVPPPVASGLVRALGDSTANNVAEELLAAWPSMTPGLRSDVVAMLVTRPQTTRELLAGIQSGVVSVSDLSLDQRLSLSEHPDRRLRAQAVKLFESAGGAIDADRQKVIERFAEATHATGNPAAGKQLFVKNCSACHKHSGEGNEIGPDLTGMAVHPKEELLIHILDPSRSVEGNFRRYTLLTAEGQVLSGMLAAESLAAVELIDAEGKRKSISREDIEEIKSTKLSLMPAGFEEQMSIAQMTDLLEFLTSKGRFVPLPLASVASAVSTKGLFEPRDNGPDRMVFSDWSPKEFQGVPFQLVDPQGKRVPNIVLLHGPNGTLPPKMPKQVTLPCNMSLKQLHLLSGVSGWGFPYSNRKSVSMIVRFHYADGETEEHPLINGVHFADYIRRVDVPESQFAFPLGNQQVRYLAISPKRNQPIASVDLVKGDDASAPIIMAITAEQAGDYQ
ncbi:Trehalose utilization [Aureliella helgolandensis]|uniref:Trehalose utilization n=2 Tax=Aureliella helgolandensis TaxID=2527968 RepID=A0A518G3H0_9BACT|nr:Trehalose utilization [Aureliella helgolandensis]